MSFYSKEGVSELPGSWSWSLDSAKKKKKKLFQNNLHTLLIKWKAPDKQTAEKVPQ